MDVKTLDQRYEDFLLPHHLPDEIWCNLNPLQLQYAEALEFLSEEVKEELLR